MPRFIAAALAACVCAPVPASAVTVVFAGSVQTVSDAFNFLDASVAPGASVSGTYEVDPSGVIGTSPFPVGPARIAFQLGGYAFDATQDPHTISLINDRVVIPAIPPAPAVTIDVWQPSQIVDADLGPATNPGGGFAGYAAQIELFDPDSNAFNGGETEPFVVTDLIGWEEARLTVNSLVANGGGAPEIDGRVQVQVRIDSWTLVPVPESRSGVLLAIGLALIALRRR